MDDFQETLRRLTIGDGQLVDAAMRSGQQSSDLSHLDRKTHALVRIAALVALDPAPHAYSHAVEAAREAGATPEEIVGALVAELSVVGSARVASAAPNVGLALGYDLDAALEDDPNR